METTLDVPIVACARCPHILTNPETVPSHLAESFQRVQRACAQYCQALAAHGGILTRELSLRVADLRLDLVKRIATRGPVSVELTPRETALLEVLMREPGKVFRRKQLLTAAWGAGFVACPNIVNVYIGRLREAVDTGFATQLIQTVHGVGYVLAG